MSQKTTADEVIDFAQNLTLVGDYSGENLVVRQWQQQIFRGLFAEKVSKALILLPRKNGKTLLCSIICLFGILTRRNQEVVSAASSGKQARMIYDQMVTIIRADTFLSSICEIFKDRIVVPHNNSFYCAVASGGDSLHGMSPTIIVIDELHAWKKQRHVEMYKALTTGSGARKALPLIIQISTQAAERETICWRELEYSRKLKGRIENGKVIDDGSIINPSYFACLYFTDPSVHDWTSPEVHRMVNPAFGDFLNADEFNDEFDLALEIPSQQQGFKQLRLNMLGSSDTKWVDMAVWDKCKCPDFPDTRAWIKGKGALPDVPEGWKCIGAGLDLAVVHDLSAFVLLFQTPEGKTAAMPFSWCNQEDIDRRQKVEGVPYDHWRGEGFIKMTDGGATAFPIMRADINEIGKKYKVPIIGADPQLAWQLGQELVTDGFDVQWVKPFYTSMSPPMRHIERLMKMTMLNVPDNPVFDYCMGNIIVDMDGSDPDKALIKPSNKKKKRQEKMDIGVAMILGQAICMPKEEKKSKWEDPNYSPWL